ncbi:hypothetical protein V3C99_011887, partial [Haemonchus contortus]
DSLKQFKMTVTYSLDVANSSFFCLYRLLFRWKGSIWKSIWAELLVWLVLYALLSIMYRVVLTKPQREIFEDLCVFFDTYSSFIPITFMLGFYVSAVFSRWWQIFDNIGWIDTPALWITQYVLGKTERARLLRRTMIRYLVLTQAIVFRDVSAGVRKRFPTMNHLVTSGLMTEKELVEFESIITTYPKYWVPMNWVFRLIRVAWEEKNIPGEVVYVDLMEKIRQYRVQILSLTLYDWVPVPLVYTQVVHLAVRTYFMVALLGRQYLHPDQVRMRNIDSSKTIDLYIPIMSILQFIFFVGWMKVAEVLLNPLGEDDDDFECNYILDRNLQVGLNVVDNAHDFYPEMARDNFWEDSLPEPLYTAESAQRTINPQVGSCVEMCTSDEPFMIHPRRRTAPRASYWEGEVENDTVVPVIGSDKLKDSRSPSTSDLNPFSRSHNSQTRKISNMYKRMQGGRRFSVTNSFRLPWRTQRISDVSNDHQAPTEMKSSHSSSSSMDLFDESFHNKISPPGLNSNTGMSRFSRSVPDGLKMAVETKGPSSPMSPSGGVAWFVDELAVIEEEGPEKRRIRSGDSLESSRSGSTSRTDQRSIETTMNIMPPVLRKEEGIGSKSQDHQESSSENSKESVT